MKNHTKVYLKGMKYTDTDFIPCEICGCEAVDIHHIEPRGMGGTSEKESVRNLMALCRKDHEQYGDKKKYKHFLTEIHLLHLKNRN